MRKKLFQPQEVHCKNLVKGLLSNRCVIDTSETGTGKTICAIYCAHLVMNTGKLLVVCPKAVIHQWKKELEEFGFAPEKYTVTNWEQLRSKKCPISKWGPIKAFFLDQEYQFVIFDEAHKAKSATSQNANMVRGVVDNSPDAKIMMLSATLANSPLEMRAVLHAIGFCTWRRYYGYIKDHLGCVTGRFNNFEFKGGEEVMNGLRNAIYGNGRGSRLTREDLKQFFGENEIISESVDFGDDGKISKAYALMEEEMLELEMSTADDKPSPLVVQLRARQTAELLKVPYIVESTEDLLAEGQHVAIFVNFRATLTAIADKLKTTCCIHGGQKDTERQNNIDRFQSGNSNVILIIISAGGVGLSLHDTIGGMPRTVLISPSWDEKELTQALGRCYRANGKTAVVQKLLVAYGTIEEKISDSLMRKLNRLSTINDFSLAEEKKVENNLNAEIEKASNTPVNMKTRAPRKKKAVEPVVEPAVLPTPKLEHEERAHSKHSPSSLDTKLQCPGFQNDQSRDKTAANRGSLGHEMVEKIDFNKAPFDPELTDAAIRCYAVLQEFEQPNSTHHVEVRLDTPVDQNGHIDHLFDHHDGTSDLIDLKFSFSSGAYSADSPQFWAYCCGIWDMFPHIETITVSILLPFLDEVDQETFTRKQHYNLFYASCMKIIEMAEAANPDTFRVGRHCTWCLQLKNGCRKWATFGVELANRFSGKTDKYVLPETTENTATVEDPETLVALWRLSPLVSAAIEGWRKNALDARLNGTDLPGLELTERKGVREITDTMGAYEAVKDVLSAEELLVGCKLKIGELEQLWKDKQPRGSKETSLGELTMRLMDASAISSGRPVQMLRECK